MHSAEPVFFWYPDANRYAARFLFTTCEGGVLAWQKDPAAQRRSRALYNSASYRKRRAALMRSVTPATRCAAPGCGKLLHEHRPHRNGKPARWHAAHVVPGRNDGPLALWASTCNLAEGARRGAASRVRNDLYGGAGAHHPMHYDLDDPASPTAPPCARRSGALCPTCASWRAKHSNPGETQWSMT